jgi:hypothetical protein
MYVTHYRTHGINYDGKPLPPWRRLPVSMLTPSFIKTKPA